MKFLTCLLVLGLAVPSTAVTLFVPADGRLVVARVTPGNYDIFASGTFFFSDWRTADWAIADAEWLRSKQFKWFEAAGLPDDVCDLMVNGQFLDWRGLGDDGNWLAHSLSPTHQYRTQVHTDHSLVFRIFDSYYPDNAGGLFVDYRLSPTAVPEPSPLAVVAASLVAFVIIARFINKRRGRGGGVDV